MADSALEEIAPGVLVRQSQFCQSNAVVVDGSDGVLLIDPGVNGRDLAELAAGLRQRGLSVVAGFATHPHWDHLLWHQAFGDGPRFGTSRCAQVAARSRARSRAEAERLAPGAPLELIGRLTALGTAAELVPWDGPAVRIIEHDGHAPGHAALVIDEAEVLVAGDMLSDVEIPLLDLRSPGPEPLAGYEWGLALLAAEFEDRDLTLVPGHGSIARGDDARARAEADRRYLAALRAGQPHDDPRLDPDASYGPGWLIRDHRAQCEYADRRAARSSS